jgi:hypothetical protein
VELLISIKVVSIKEKEVFLTSTVRDMHEFLGSFIAFEPIIDQWHLHNSFFIMKEQVRKI